MENKLGTLIEYLKKLCSIDLERVINFALGIVTANDGLPERPVCPHCGGKEVIKYGHKGGKQQQIWKCWLQPWGWFLTI